MRRADTRDDLETARRWFARCLGSQSVSLESAREMSRDSCCPVWECLVDGEAAVLKVYSPGFDDYSELGPADTARKHALALAEMPGLSVPTPRVLGFAKEGEEAALAMEHVKALPWRRGTRVEAARALAALHSTPLTSFSSDLAGLVKRSRPNRDRVGHLPDEPPVPQPTLQHGDYFSLNILQAEDGLRVVDWDLLAVGDPMWDLAFLLEADRGVTEEESEAVMSAYEAGTPSNHTRLAWQRECWRAYWCRRDEAGW